MKASKYDEQLDIYSRRIETILDWAEANSWFDSGFIQSVKSFIEATDTITDRQMISIDNIWNKFAIEDWYYANDKDLQTTEAQL